LKAKLFVQSNLSITASLGTEKSGYCREVADMEIRGVEVAKCCRELKIRVNVWTIHWDKKGGR